MLGWLTISSPFHAAIMQPWASSSNVVFERRQPMSTSTKTNLQIEFEIVAPAAEYRGMVDHVAPAIAAVPGLLWKLWIFDEEKRRGGGVYLFADRESAAAYLEGPIISRLRGSPAIAGFSARMFGVLEAPSTVTRGLR
jgi:hypothetical protein